MESSGESDDLDQPVVPGAGSTSSTEAAIITLTRQIMSAVDARDYRNPIFQKLISPQFRGQTDGKAPPCSATEHLYNHFLRCMDNPDYHVDVLDVMADVDEHHGRAKVWVSTRISNFQGRVERAGVHVFSWRRRAGEWICFSHSALRGLESYT